jgi:formylglycine-generating enzyme
MLMSRSSLVFARRRFFDGWTVPKFAVLVSLALLAAFLCTAPAHAVTIDWVTVGDPGNAADTAGAPNPAGAVADTFRIMKFEFKNSQYAAFLNAVDPSGTNPYSIYNASMTSTTRGGITNTGTTDGSRYAVKADMGDKPVNYVNWFDAARVANWLQNGQGSGSTETGAYTLVGGQTFGPAPARNANAQFYIPTEDQWYKAAYYKGGSTNAGYWAYPTQSDTAPTPTSAGATGIGTAGGSGNFANYLGAAVWNGPASNVTSVGSNGGPSAYGTFDMGGNVEEFNDLDGITDSSRGVRGGFYGASAFQMSSQSRASGYYVYEGDDYGFRLAGTVAPVPEPATWVMAAGGLACAGFGVWRRRKRA